jgi:hypothetical protein
VPVDKLPVAAVEVRIACAAQQEQPELQSFVAAVEMKGLQQPQVASEEGDELLEKSAC